MGAAIRAFPMTVAKLNPTRVSQAHSIHTHSRHVTKSIQTNILFSPSQLTCNSLSSSHCIRRHCDRRHTTSALGEHESPEESTSGSQTRTKLVVDNECTSRGNLENGQKAAVETELLPLVTPSVASSVLTSSVPADAIDSQVSGGGSQVSGSSHGAQGNEKKGSRLSGSSRLKQWARVRRKVRLPSEQKLAVSEATTSSSSKERFDTMIEKDDSSGSSTDEDEEDGAVKEIYLVSDGTGWTADHAVQAALGQFDYCFVDGRCPVKTRLYSQVREVEKLLEILRSAGENRALVVYTLVEPSMSDVARTACTVMRIPFCDMMSPLLSSVEEHLGVSAQRLPRGSAGRKSPLSKEYFRRIEAVDFTIKQDDGAHPRNLSKADIVLIGVSRTGKTPLSIYLAQKGYKVANVPLVQGIPPPPELFTINQNLIFALTIDPFTLEAIRRSRFATLGLIPNVESPSERNASASLSEGRQHLLSASESPGDDADGIPREDTVHVAAASELEGNRGSQEKRMLTPSEYEDDRGSLEKRIWARMLERGGGSEGSFGARQVPGNRGVEDNQAKYYSLGSIRAELEQMHQLFRENPLWPVIDVTGRAVEETAAEILAIRYERIHRQSMPYVSRRY